jgi:hypothetical protein
MQRQFLSAIRTLATFLLITEPARDEKMKLCLQLQWQLAVLALAPHVLAANTGGVRSTSQPKPVFSGRKLSPLCLGETGRHGECEGDCNDDWDCDVSNASRNLPALFRQHSYPKYLATTSDFAE